MNALISLSGGEPAVVIHRVLKILARLQLTRIEQILTSNQVGLSVVSTASPEQISQSAIGAQLQQCAAELKLKLEISEIAAEPFPQSKIQSTFKDQKRLLLLDVDSTLIQQEVIELLARKAGAENRVTAITQEAMSGRIDFATALIERVRLLEGLPEAVLQEVTDEITLTVGASKLIETLQSAGHAVGLVSGGFIEVIAPLAQKLHINFVRANSLEIKNGYLTGRVSGKIIDRAGKATALLDFARQSQVSLANTIAIGDGANDIEMLQSAGIGIAFNAKSILQSVADISLTTPYLDCALHLIGLSDAQDQQ